MFTGGPFNGDYITMISSRKIYVWRSTITLFVCALIVVGCSHQSPSELVAEAVSLADIGDNASWREARVKLESAVDNGGDGRPLKLFYAIALERTNDSNAAIAVAKEIQRLAPDTFMPNYLTGKLNYDRGNYQDAVRYLKRAAGPLWRRRRPPEFAGRTRNPGAHYAGRRLCQQLPAPQRNGDLVRQPQPLQRSDE
jgi:hypothetical protein